MGKENPFRISVLISGSGHTLKNLIEYRDRDELPVEIASVLASSRDATGRAHAESAGIPVDVVHWSEFRDVERFSEMVFDRCRLHGTDLVVMGGFLKRVAIPPDFENRAVNIHPSLIPMFCGKGYYGLRVHRAVIDYGCRFTGCTVHFVDNQYDHGPIIAQSVVPVRRGDDAQHLASRVFRAECELYPQVITAIAQGRVTISGRAVHISP